MYMIRVGNPENHEIIDGYRRAVDTFDSQKNEYNAAQLEVARIKLISLINAERGAIHEASISGRQAE